MFSQAFGAPPVLFWLHHQQQNIYRQVSMAKNKKNGKVQGNVNRKDKAESISDEIGMQPSQKQLLY